MRMDEDDVFMSLKMQLVACISEIITQKNWTQTRAARELAVSRSRLCRMLGGQVDVESEGRMLRCLTSLGRDIHITVGPEHVGVGQILVIKDKT